MALFEHAEDLSNMASNVGGVARDQLKSIVERVERLNEDKKAIADDIKEVYGEAKANGFDVKVLRAMISRRAKDKAELSEFDAMLELYEGVFG